MFSVSGVMPVKNAEEYLPYSLATLLHAPLDELIVVIEDSSDNSENILKKFHPNYPVHLFHKKTRKWNNKIADAVEYGFALARGDVIYSLFSDCAFDVNIFSPSALALFKRYDMISFQYYVRDLHTNPIQTNYESLLRRAFEKIDFKQQMWIGAIFATKRQVWRKIRFRDTPSLYGENIQFQDYKERLERAGHNYFHVKTTRNFDLRDFSLSKENQLLQGKGRILTDYPLWRVLLHSILHIKPYVLIGYLRSPKNEKA